jgi:hypothetical protein
MPHRSPVIFWLLLAATLCVDIVATVWLFKETLQLRSATLFMAMAYAQISILCVWAVLRSTTIRFRWVVPFVPGFLAALTITLAQVGKRSGAIFTWEVLLAFVSLMWVHVASLLLMLWLLKPTRLLASYIDGSRERSWQFTIKHLLILSTGIPVLVIVFKNSEIVHSGVTSRGFVEFVSWVIGNIALTVVIAAIAPKKWAWLLKLASYAGAGLALGPFLQWAVPELSRESFSIPAFSLMQAFVVGVWLETLQLHRPPKSGEVENPPTSEAERKTI